MDHSYFLRKALDQAIKAKEEGQNPIGCVIADQNRKIIASAHNEVMKRKDQTAHAEMLAIRKIIDPFFEKKARTLVLYTTLEPCIMCLGTILVSNIGTVVWGANDRRIESHKLLMATPFMKTRKLITVACPDPSIEKECERLHDEYWISMGRPEVVQPISNGSNML